MAANKHLKEILNRLPELNIQELYQLIAACRRLTAYTPVISEKESLTIPEIPFITKEVDFLYSLIMNTLYYKFQIKAVLPVVKAEIVNLLETLEGILKEHLAQFVDREEYLRLLTVYIEKGIAYYLNTNTFSESFPNHFLKSHLTNLTGKFLSDELLKGNRRLLEINNFLVIKLRSLEG